MPFAPAPGLRRAARQPALAVVLAAIGGAAVTAAAAADLRVESIAPAGPGAVDITVAPGGRAVAARLAVRVDGAPAAVALAPPANDRVIARVTGLSEGARWLEVGTSGKTFEPAAAFPLSERAPGGPEDWIVYHVYLATFRNGDPENDGAIRGWRDAKYAGGDLAGVLASLAHVRSVGANAVWLSPVFESPSSHGYDVANYWRIADALGVPGKPDASLALFRRLVAQAKDSGIRTILDVPLNHAARGYDLQGGDPLRLSPKSTGPRQDAEKLWDSWGGAYRYWNFDDDATRRFLVEAALHWLRDEGVAGLRLDYVRGVPNDFWATFRDAVEKTAPGAFLVGECWKDDGSVAANAKEIARYFAAVPGRGPQFPVLFDFPMQMTMTDVFARGRDATLLEDTLAATAAAYGPDARPGYFLDNHDTARFMDWTDDPRRLDAALAFMASLSGPQFLYYGTEAGLSGAGAKAGFTDAGRVPMPWDRLDPQRIARLGALFAARAAHPALARGARWPVQADRTSLVMAKTTADQTALVGVNLAAEPRTIEIDGSRWFRDGAVPASVVGASSVAPATPAGAPAGEEPAAATSGGAAGGAPRPRDAARSILRWTLPPMSTSIIAGPRR